MPQQQPDKPATVTKVIKFMVDMKAMPDTQRELLERHAGTARAAWNWGLAEVNAQQRLVQAHVKRQALAESSDDWDAAKKLLADKKWRTAAYHMAEEQLGKVPNAVALSARFTEMGRDPQSRFGWWSTEKHGVNRFAASTALRDLDTARKRFLSGAAKRGKGRKKRADGFPGGWPRFKKKGRSQDAFALFNIAVSDSWKPLQRRGASKKAPLNHSGEPMLESHRINLPSLGSVRVTQNTTKLRRMVRRGGHPKSARFVRNGDRWEIAINVSFQADNPYVAPPTKPNRIQIAGGVTGIDLGLGALIAFPDGRLIENPQVGKKEQAKLARLRRKYSRQHVTESPECFEGSGVHVKGSCAWRGGKGVPAKMTSSSRETLRGIRKTERLVAQQRATVIHQQTKMLTTQFATVCIEDLRVANMSARPKAKDNGDGSFAQNGRSRKKGLNKSILRSSFYEFRRQLEYKSKLYGSKVVVIDRWTPTSKTCSSCGSVKPKLKLSERIYRCQNCGLVMDRDVNAARNILSAGLAEMERRGAERVVQTRVPGDAVSGSHLAHGPHTGTEPCGTTVGKTPKPSETAKHSRRGPGLANDATGSSNGAVTPTQCRSGTTRNRRAA